MRRATACLVALTTWLAAFAPAAHAQEARPWQAELGAGVERFSNQLDDWQQLDFALRHRFAPRTLAEGTLRQTRRRGFDDSELGGGFSLPLDADWTLAGAASASPTHRVLAKAGGRIDLSRALADGWVLGAGLGRSLYEGEGASGTSGSSIARLNVERYVAGWRFAAGILRSRLDGGQNDNGGLLQVDRYFADERGRLGLIVARGRELENDPSLGGVLSTRVETLALVGAWPLDPDWTLLGALSSTRQSDAQVRTGPRAGQGVGQAYRRNGIRLGVQRDF